MEHEELQYLAIMQHDREQRRRIVAQSEISEHARIKASLPRSVVTALHWDVYTESEKIAKASVICNKPLDRSFSSNHHTILSPHLGVCRREDGPCITCNQVYPDCDGHFGYIALPATYNPQYINHVPMILSLFCHVCGAARFKPLTENSPELAIDPGPARWSFMRQTLGLLPCQNIVEGKQCGTPCEEFVHLQKKTALFTIKRGPNLFSATEALNALNKVHPPSACGDLGIKSVEHLVARFIIQSILVPPTRSRDPAANKILNSIVKDVAHIHKMSNDCKWDKLARMNELHNNIAMLNVGNGKTQNQSNTTEGYMQTLFNGKEGLPRSALIRPRNVNTCYSVVTPYMEYPNVFAVPRIFQSKLTCKERVNMVNIGWLNGLLREEKVKSIDALDPNSGAYQPVPNINRYELKHGDIVRRFLMDGDLINPVRTPTFHAQGMLVFRVRLWNRLVFGVFTPSYVNYGGDFDGDTMVGHILNSAGARAEGLAINSVRNLFIDRTSGFGLNGPHYNSPLGCYYMSQDEKVAEEVRRKCHEVTADQPQMKTLLDRLRLNNVPLESGRALFSAALPARLVYGDMIRMGCLVKGKLTVEMVRDGPDCLLKHVLEQYGPQEAERFVYNVTRFAGIYLENRSVTIGYTDIMKQICDKNGAHIAKEVYTGFQRRVHELMETEQNPTRLEESLSMETINMNNLLAQMIREAVPDGTITDYTAAGISKMAQNRLYINGMVGQQYIDGNRLAVSRAYGNPDAWKMDLANRGFIKESFAEGLTPAGVLNHGTVMRKSLTDQKCSDQPGVVLLHVANAVDNIVTTFQGSTMMLDGSRMIELVYGGSGLSTTRTWYAFSGRHYRTFLNLATLSKRLMQERVSIDYIEGPIRHDEFQAAVYSRAFQEDQHRNATGYFNPHAAIVNRAEDPVCTSFSLDTAIFDLAVESIEDNTQGVPVYGQSSFVIVTAWLYDAIVAPVVKNGDFRFLRRHVKSVGVLAYLLWNWRNIYEAVRVTLSVAHELEFQSVLFNLSDYMDNEVSITATSFIALFRRDVELLDLDVRRLVGDLHVPQFSRSEKAYQTGLKHCLSKCTLTTDHSSLVDRACRREILQVFPLLVVISRCKQYALATVVSLAYEAYHHRLRHVPSARLYALFSAKYQDTDQGRRERLLRMYNKIEEPVKKFNAQFKVMVANHTMFEQPLMDTAPFYHALADTDQFKCTQWRIMDETTKMAASVLCVLLYICLDQDIEVMMYKAPYFAHLFSKYWIDMHEEHLLSPVSVYMTPQGQPFVLTDAGHPRQRGEYLVFQHYLFMFMWLATKRGDILQGNAFYWEHESIRLSKKIRLC